MGSFTIALLQALLSAGVSPERARDVVDLFDRSVDERYSLHAQILATKRDVAELETRLTRDLAELGARLTRDVAECNARIAETRSSLAADVAECSTRVTEARSSLSVGIAECNARIAEARTDLTRWMLAALTAQTALIIGAIKVL